MSIFDIFKPQSNDTKVEKLISLLKEKTTKNGYKLVIDEEQIPSIFDSKLGGIPYWDLTKEFPKDSTNQNMQLLAQINFEQITSNNSDLPQKGLLQFFITAQNTDYGVDFSNPTEQNNFRVVYHEQIDSSVTVEAINKLNIPKVMELIQLRFSRNVLSKLNQQQLIFKLRIPTLMKYFVLA